MCTLLCLLAAAAPAATVSGIGARDCRDFLHAVDRGQKPAIDGYVSWAQGFLSAFNWLDAEGRSVTADPHGLTYWLVDYCGQHRGAPFYAAVQAFVEHHAR